jgi:rhodanese-related sulfurtransferase
MLFSFLAPVPAISVTELRARLAHGGVVLIDVREPDEFEIGHIEGARNIPLHALEGFLHELHGKGEVLLYCRSGGRSARATEALTEVGISALNVSGGIQAWEREGFEIVSS